MGSKDFIGLYKAFTALDKVAVKFQGRKKDCKNSVCGQLGS
jgi:hypothetical protein